MLFIRPGTFENCLSNLHDVTRTILQKTIPKGNPKTILYKDYKSFDQNKFNEELNSKIKKLKTARHSLIRCK